MLSVHRESNGIIFQQDATVFSLLHVCRQLYMFRVLTPIIRSWYTQSNKNPSAWYFVRPAQAVTCGTVAIIIRVVLLSPYLRIRGLSPSSIHFNQSHRVYINT